MKRIETVGIVGAGTMGGGIAASLARHGFRVLLADSRPEAVAAAVAGAGAFYGRAVEKGRMAREEADAAVSRILPAGRHEDFAPADLVVEAVFEGFGLKAGLFEALVPALREDALVATNTSCLRVGDLARHVRGPERFLGLHYFSPAAVNPIVEVVQGEATADAAVDAALAFCRASGKRPLRCNDSHGFAINRFFCPYTNEAARALDEGLGSTGEIDAVAREVLGVAAGPFAVMNLIKPRINLHAIRNLAPLGPFYAPTRHGRGRRGRPAVRGRARRGGGRRARGAPARHRRPAACSARSTPRRPPRAPPWWCSAGRRGCRRSSPPARASSSRS